MFAPRLRYRHCGVSMANREMRLVCGRESKTPKTTDFHLAASKVMRAPSLSLALLVAETTRANDALQAVREVTIPTWESLTSDTAGVYRE